MRSRTQTAPNLPPNAIVSLNGSVLATPEIRAPPSTAERERAVGITADDEIGGCGDMFLSLYQKHPSRHGGVGVKEEEEALSRDFGTSG